jgi:ATP-dependent helicase HepA
MNGWKIRGRGVLARSKAIKSGDLLVATGSDLGVGKALKPGPGGGVILEFFDAPGLGAHQEEFTHAQLRRFTLSEGEQIFWQDDRGWLSGRVLYVAEDGDIFARTPNADHRLSEKQVYVRWMRPLDDIVAFATADLTTSPYLAESRRPFLAGMRRQRAAARGFGSLTSSVIQLHAHQLEVARRVLEDPVQRYLLADEVGLGKTIEAGLVLRQLALDLGRLEIGIIAPPFLLGQWQRELQSKFQLDLFPLVTVSFWRNDDVSLWSACDVLVVDEAHQLAGRAEHSDPALAASYSRLASVCHSSTRLLLLSATPVLSDAAAFLGMLHLLDPTVHRLEDLEAFAARVNSRQNLGRIMLGLNPGLPKALLRPYLDQLAELFPDDPELAELLAAALEALESGDPAVSGPAVNRIRVHLSEVHRLHRRMLRNRRTEGLRQTFNVVGRTAPDLLHVDTGSLDDALSAWCDAAALETAGDDAALSRAADLLGRLIEASVDPASLRREIEDAIAGGAPGVELLQALASRAEDHSVEDHAAAASDALLDVAAAGRKTVVFAGTTALADGIYRGGTEILGVERVAAHTFLQNPAEADTALGRFASFGTGVDVLVCDRSAEDGRNLQFAGALIHVGLPADANRLEQRIGRLDRWSLEDSSWSSTIVNVGLLPRWTTAWHEVLAKGFGIFDGSIASLQHAVSAASNAAWLTLLEEGPDAAGTASERVRSMLEDETRRVLEQDAIDAIEAVADNRTVHRELAAVEEDESAFATAGHWLLGGSGNLRLGSKGDPENGIGEYLKIAGHGRSALHPMMPTWRLLRLFNRRLLDGRKVTFHRARALRSFGTSLLRFGDPLLEEITDMLLHDHVGRSWMLWRQTAEWQRPERAFLRFDVLVEADVDTSGLRDDVARIVRREADALLPPVVGTRWLDLDGKEPDAGTQRLLELPYASDGAEDGSYRDHHLHRGRLAWLDELVPTDDRVKSWRKAEKQVLKSVRSLEMVEQALGKAQADAARILPMRRQQLQLRLRAVADPERQALRADIEERERHERIILSAISDPRVRIDGVGLVVLASAVPPEPES